MSVKVTADRNQVAIVTETTGDTTEERTYFLDPAVCVDMANLMLKCATECGIDVRMQTDGVTDARRLQLVKRCELVIKSLSGRKPQYIAFQVVDTILSEVL